ncbi:CheR family methyltransferase [Tepidamorphus sp. 3E244]|uniref:CheR family methyltransferase n=1 Tax=Tepidamorphus sp. 3E244 TaxID=3385498 RepID=UPI0038FC2D5E
MTPADFAFFQTFLKQRSGLALAADKEYLLESRLKPILRRNSIEDIGEVARELRAGRNRALENAVVEAMTTNESFFFRDKTPFDQFRDQVMPDIIKTRGVNKRLRVWCAAASTGQEPYSISMILKEMAPQLPNWRTEIIGTDLSNEVLEKARAGLYSQFEVQRGLPVQMLLKYFEQQGEMWQLNPAIRAMVQYRTLNLLENFSNLGQFDVVFCRNVLIYFDAQTKLDVLNRISRVLAPDGYLVLGAAETVVGLTTDFVPQQGGRGIYRPNGHGKAAERPAMRLAANGGAFGGIGSGAAAPAASPVSATRAGSNVLPITGVRPR